MSPALRGFPNEGEIALIKSVELENWKAFDSLKIDFLGGVNFLIGPNAVGKTSILEAISLAFTAEALTVDDPKELVKEGKNGPAKIAVDFLHKNRNYRIERSLSKKKCIESTIYSDEESLAEGWNSVSEYLKRLLGIDKRFFERVIYMPEGDIFRFLADPPEKGIMAQIENALGIDRMEYFLGEIEAQIKYYQDREEHHRAQRNLLKKLLPEAQIEQRSSARRKKELEKVLDDLEVQSDNIAEKVFKCKTQMKRLKEVISDLDVLEDELKDLVRLSGFHRNPLKEIRRVLDITRNKLEQTTSEMHPKLKERGALEERIRHQSIVLELLSSVDMERERSVNCPVCGKPLSLHEAKDLKSTYRKQRKDASEILSALEGELDELRTLRKNLEESLERLERCWIRLTSMCEELETESLGRKEIRLRLKACQQEMKTLSTQRAQLSTRLEQTRDTLSTLEHNIQMQRKIEEAGSLPKVEADLVSIAKALIALELLQKATEGTIRRQRQRKLKPVYKEITAV